MAIKMKTRYEFLDEDGNGYFIERDDAGDGRYRAYWQIEDNWIEPVQTGEGNEGVATERDALLRAAKDWLAVNDVEYVTDHPRHIGLLLAAHRVEAGVATTPAGDFWWAVDVETGEVQAANEVFTSATAEERTKEFRRAIVPFSGFATVEEDDEDE